MHGQSAGGVEEGEDALAAKSGMADLVPAVNNRAATSPRNGRGPK